MAMTIGYMAPAVEKFKDLKQRPVPYQAMPVAASPRESEIASVLLIT